MHEGVLESGDASFGAPEHAQAQDAKGIAYVRPHDIEVDRYSQAAVGSDGIVVRLRRAHAIGPLAQLELERADNQELIEAVISNERFTQLGLLEGESLIVRPKRLHVFVEPSAAVAQDTL